MRILVLATLLAATSSVAAPNGSQAEDAGAPGQPAIPAPLRGTTCQERVIRADTIKPPQARRLADLPPGDTLLAVYRVGEDGCIDPLIVRYGDGRRAPAAPEATRPRARRYR